LSAAVVFLPSGQFDVTTAWRVGSLARVEVYAESRDIMTKVKHRQTDRQTGTERQRNTEVEK